jgi:serine/threonine protein kinase
VYRGLNPENGQIVAIKQITIAGLTEDA